MCASETCDIFEALALDPLLAHNNTSTPNTRNPDHADINPYLDHNDEFSSKTDQAPEISGIVLPDTEAGIENWCVSTKAAPSSCIIPNSHGTFELRSRFRIPNLKVKNKTKKIKDRTAHLLNGISSIVSLPPQNISPRWNLRDFTTTMADILSGKTFKKQADGVNFDMENQREISKVEKVQKLSISSTVNHKAIEDAQTETMHQTCFPLFKKAHYAQRNPPGLVLTPPATPEHQDFSTKSSGGNNIKSSRTSAHDMVFENLSFPSPPRKWNGCLTPPEDPHLPRVSEDFLPVSQRQKAAKVPSKLLIPTNLAPTSGFVTLSSTPFTLTSPRFRHGPIRVDRRQKCFSPEDTSMDWAAFQMAIIGVIDDREIEMDEVDCRMGEAELNDIAQWFSDFGLEIGSWEKEESDGWGKAYI